MKELLPLLKAGLVHGAAHITGGGFLENLPRMFSSSLAAEIQLNSWPVLPIFKLIQKYGEIPSEEMYEIFNMGLGMILAVSQSMLKKFRSFYQKLLKLVVWYLGKRKPLFLRKPYEDSCFCIWQW